MATVDNLPLAAEFLAGKLMGWFKEGEFWIDSTTQESPLPIRERQSSVQRDEHELYQDPWLPYADTPEGLWQCLGEGGIVEKMREKGWMLKFNVYQLLYEAYFYNPKTKESTWPMTDNFTKGVAIVLAAATALGWKEE